MRVGPLGIWELLAILAIILLIFGAKRLPEIGASLGRGIRTFKSSVTGEDEKDERDEQEAHGADRRSDNNGREIRPSGQRYRSKKGPAAAGPFSVG